MIRNKQSKIRELEKQVDYLSGVIVKEQIKIKAMQDNIKMLEADVDRLRKGANNG